MKFQMLVRWTAIAGLAALVAACGLAPGPVALERPAAAQAAADAEGKPPEYEKVFPTLYRPQPFPVKVIAHRGYSKVAPENTLSAIKAAVEAGADAIEFDIRLSRDGHPVVIHDADVERTSDGEGKVDKMTLEELRQLDFGGWYGPAFRGERIATLEEALLVMRGRSTPVIEVKSREKEMAQVLSDTLKKLGMSEHVYVTSFYSGPLNGLRKLAPEVPRAVLVPPIISINERALDMRASTTQGFHRSIEQPAVVRAHALGLQVHAWTVNERAGMLALIGKGLDGLITDDVDLLRTVLKERFPSKPSVNPHSLWGILYPVEPGDTPPVSVY